MAAHAARLENSEAGFGARPAGWLLRECRRYQHNSGEQ
jgi:hypothetical protein